MTKPTAKSAAANERRNLKLLFLTRLSLSRLIHRITFVHIVEIVKIIIKLKHWIKTGYQVGKLLPWFYPCLKL